MYFACMHPWKVSFGTSKYLVVICGCGNLLVLMCVRIYMRMCVHVCIPLCKLVGVNTCDIITILPL